MSPKLDLYDLGARGVVLNESPVHKQPGDLTKAQNVYHSKEEGMGGLRKRPGLTKVNAIAAAGSITGITNLPFPDTDSDVVTLYASAAREDTDWGTTLWRTSTNGTTWANATTPSAAQDIVTQQTGDWNVTVATPIASLSGKIYYPGNDYTVGTTAPTLHCWDGTTDFTVFKVPDHPSYAGTRPRAIYGMVAANGMLYFSTLDRAQSGNAPNHAGRVFEYNPDNGSVQQIGTAFGPNSGEATGGWPYAMVWWLGRLWVTTNSYSGSAGDDGTVKWIRPGIDTTWTSDVTFTDLLGLSMAVFNSALYVGCRSTLTAGTGQAVIRKRTAAGTWSTDDSGTANEDGHYSSLVVFSSALYAARVTVQAGGSEVIRKYDGTSWTTDQNVWTLTATDRNVGGQLVSAFSKLYYLARTTLGTADAEILQLSGGTWTLVNTTEKLRMMAVLTTPN